MNQDQESFTTITLEEFNTNNVVEHPTNPASSQLTEALRAVAKDSAFYGGSIAVVTIGNFLGAIFIASDGPTTLAAYNMASVLQNCATTMVTSSLGATSKMLGTKIGEGKDSEVGGIYRTSLIFTLLLGIPGMIVMLASKPLLLSLDQEEEVAQLTQDFLFIYVIGIPATFGLFANRRLALATNNIECAFAFDVFWQTLDTILSYCFVHGTKTIPKSGITGLAKANTISIWLTFIFSTVYMINAKRFTKYQLNTLHCVDFRANLKEMFENGLPIFIRVGFELGTLLSANLMIGLMGVDQEAAQEIVLQYAGFANIATYAITDTNSAMMSKLLGANSFMDAKNCGYTASLTAIGLALFIQIILVVFADFFIDLFIDADQSANQVLFNTARTLLWINACSSLVEAARSVLSSSLTSLGLADKATQITVVTQLLIFVPASYLLGFQANLKAPGIMMGRSLAILASMLAFLYLYKNTKNNIRTPEHIDNPLPKTSVCSWFKRSKPVNIDKTALLSSDMKNMVLM